MAKITLNKLNLKLNKDVVDLYINDEVTIKVKQYLPQDEKAELVTYVLDSALDENTGCFSPIRLETYFAMALVKFYSDIAFTDKQMLEISKTYDLLESNGIIEKIINAIPSSEYNFLNAAVNDTAADISRYNNSFAGMMSMMSTDANNLNTQVTEILTKIRNKEGLEELSVIKDAVI